MPKVALLMLTASSCVAWHHGKGRSPVPALQDQAFALLEITTDDRSPDAHACRLKILLATFASPLRCPWRV